jgi:hypothetical protein
MVENDVPSAPSFEGERAIFEPLLMGLRKLNLIDKSG